MGYAAFWPKCRKWASHARVKIAKEYPILGRYLFVEIPDANFFAVRSVDGIEGLLTGDDRAPAKVPPEVVYAFRDRYMRGEWDFVANETGEFINKRGAPETRRNPIPIGARVKIMEGEFSELLTVVRGFQNGKVKFLPPGKSKFFFTREDNVRAA